MGLTVTDITTPLLFSDDLIAHLRLDPTDDRCVLDQLDALAQAAVEYVENETRTCITPTPYRLTLDGFPHGPALTLPRPPLRSVGGISYVGVDGTTAMVDPTLYAVDTSGRPGRAVLKLGQRWPETNRSAGCVQVEFTAGYCNAADMPRSLRLACLMLAGHWYEHREAAMDRRIDEVPMAVSNILAQYRTQEAW